MMNEKLDCAQKLDDEFLASQQDAIRATGRSFRRASGPTGGRRAGLAG